jgi:hypothetical protein
MAYEAHTLQERVTVLITKREAILLQKMRKLSYAEFVVKKVDGLIVRVEILQKENIEPDQEIELT